MNGINQVLSFNYKQNYLDCTLYYFLNRIIYFEASKNKNLGLKNNRPSSFQYIGRMEHDWSSFLHLSKLQFFGISDPYVTFSFFTRLFCYNISHQKYLSSFLHSLHYETIPLHIPNHLHLHMFTWFHSNSQRIMRLSLCQCISYFARYLFD